MIQPSSILGILWLQTHFNKDHWKAIAESQAIIPTNDASLLLKDASNAGLSIDFIPALAK